MFILKMIVSQIKGNIYRYVSIFISISIAVMFIQITYILNNTLKYSLTETIAGELINTDIVIHNKNYKEAEKGITREQYNIIKNCSGVLTTSVADNIYGSLVKDINNDVDSFAEIKLSSIMDKNIMPPKQIIEGVFPNFSNEAVIDIETAKKYNIQLNQSIIFKPNKDENKINSFDEKIIKIVGIVNTQIGNAASYSSLFVHDSLIENSLVEYKTVYVKANNGFKIEYLNNELQEKIGNTLKVETKVDFLNELLSTFFHGLMIFMKILWFFVFLSVFISILIVANTFNIILPKRIKELSLLRILGAKKWQIKQYILIEASFVGLIASIGGIAFTYFILHIIILLGKKYTLFSKEWVPHITDMQALIGVLAGILLCCFCSYPSARKAAKTKPLQVFRTIESLQNNHSLSALRVYCGGIFFILFLIFSFFSFYKNNIYTSILGAIFGIFSLITFNVLIISYILKKLLRKTLNLSPISKLAISNIIDNSKRSGNTAKSLLIGTILISILLTSLYASKTYFLEKIDTKFPIDVLISISLSNRQVVEEKLHKIQSHPMVELASIASVGNININDKYENVMVVDCKDLIDISHSNLIINPGEIISPIDKKFTNDVIVSNIYENRKFSVKNKDFANFFHPNIIISYEDYMRYNEDFSDNFFILVKVNNSISHREAYSLSNSLAQIINVEKSFIFGSLEIKAQLNIVVQKISLGILAFLIVSTIFSMISIYNIISLSILERRREFSILRALGLTKQQLNLLIFKESFFISIINVTLGVIIGTFFSLLFNYCLLGNLGIPYLPLRYILLIFFIGIISGILPAIMQNSLLNKISISKELSKSNF